MKYIKTFENSLLQERMEHKPHNKLSIAKNFSYEIGNYVYIKNAEEWVIYPFVEIIDRDSNKSNYSEFSETKNNTWIDDYYVTAHNKITGKKEHFWIDAVDIERELTLEEIEDYKMVIDAKKYNL